MLLPDDYDEVKNLVFIFERSDIKHINPVPNLDTRCTICNGILKKVDKTLVTDPIPEKAYESISTIYKCSKCSKVYWEGTHVDDINKLIVKINNLLKQYK